MPDPDPTQGLWLGVVTGIRLAHIIAAATAEKQGGFLVKTKRHSPERIRPPRHVKSAQCRLPASRCTSA